MPKKRHNKIQEQNKPKTLTPSKTGHSSSDLQSRSIAFYLLIGIVLFGVTSITFPFIFSLLQVRRKSDHTDSLSRTLQLNNENINKQNKIENDLSNTVLDFDQNIETYYSKSKEREKIKSHDREEKRQRKKAREQAKNKLKEKLFESFYSETRNNDFFSTLEKSISTLPKEHTRQIAHVYLKHVLKNFVYYPYAPLPILELIYEELSDQLNPGFEYHGLNPFFRRQSESVIDFLLKQGVSVNLQSTTLKNTPIHYFMANEMFFMVRTFITYLEKNHLSFDVSLRDFEGKTALMLAVRVLSLEMVELLIAHDKAKVSIHIPDNQGNTALHFACLLGQMDIAQILIENGADINAVNRYGETPAHYLSKDVAFISKALLDVCMEPGRDVGACCNSLHPIGVFSFKELPHPSLHRTECPSEANTPKPRSEPQIMELRATKENALNLLSNLHTMFDKKSIEDLRNQSKHMIGKSIIEECIEGKLATAELLIQRGANLSILDNNGKRALDSMFYLNTPPSSNTYSSRFFRGGIPMSKDSSLEQGKSQEKSSMPSIKSLT